MMLSSLLHQQRYISISHSRTCTDHHIHHEKEGHSYLIDMSSSIKKFFGRGQL